MAYATSTISFGGYTFPASFALVARDQPTVIDEVKIPYLDGTNAPTGTRNSKVITVKGTIGGPGSVDSSGFYILGRDQAEAEANVLSSYLESGYQQLSVGATPARFILAQKRKSSFTYLEGTKQSAIGVEIEFVAPDPRWLAAVPTTFPASPVSSINGTPVSVNGAGIVYPVFTFTGAYGNPAVWTTPAGLTGSVGLNLSYLMATGDQIVIDCDPRNRANGVLLNGAPRLDLISLASTNTTGGAEFFPYLIASKQFQNTVAAFGSPNGANVSVTWREAYLF